MSPINSNSKNGELNYNKNILNVVELKSNLAGHIHQSLSDIHRCTYGSEDFPKPMMDRSVDSIGTCSLDLEVSADLSGTQHFLLYIRGDLY